MPHVSTKGYSFLIRPLIISFDLGVIVLCTLFYTSDLSNAFFYTYVLLGWLIASVLIKFYNVYRFTSGVQIFGLIVKQGILFTFTLFSLFGVLSSRSMATPLLLSYISSIMLIVSIAKFLVYYALKKYRLKFGGNNRRVLIFGNSKQTKDLIYFFNSKKNLGYQIKGIFSDDIENNLAEGINFLSNNNIDEVYCALYETSNPQINEIVNYCDTYGIVLKFIPNVQKVPVTNLRTDYYDYIPVFSVPEMPLHGSINILVKRALDIIFSIIVIFGILSWLVPLLYIIIKLDSKGPLFYVHKRNGVNYGEFSCYKFRSLSISGSEDRLHVSEEDERVTRIGRFLRRTSMDELPQFVNVLKGEMSVVGPRPHIPRYTNSYAKKIDKYQFVFRHSVKPGITGLAQVKGFRGEIKLDDDIINRIKYDVFYIENWSVFLDIQIIFDTIILLFKGQKKAY